MRNKIQALKITPWTSEKQEFKGKFEIRNLLFKSELQWKVFHCSKRNSLPCVRPTEGSEVLEMRSKKRDVTTSLRAKKRAEHGAGWHVDFLRRLAAPVVCGWEPKGISDYGARHQVDRARASKHACTYKRPRRVHWLSRGSVLMISCDFASKRKRFHSRHTEMVFFSKKKIRCINQTQCLLVRAFSLLTCICSRYFIHFVAGLLLLLLLFLSTYFR